MTNRIVSALAWSTALCLAVAACNRSAGPPPKPFDGSPSDAEVALRALGDGVFEVTRFAVEGGEYKELDDHVRFGISLYDMRYAADLRLTRPLALEPRDDLVERHRRAGSPVEELERDLALVRLLGPGEHAAGMTKTVEGSAVFEETEAGWRLATVDRRWRLVSE